eukprot:gene8605-553_t
MGISTFVLLTFPEIAFTTLSHLTMQTDYTLPEEFISLKKGPIHKSSNSHVYVGNFNSKKCVLKIFPTKFPSEETIRSYQKDYQINALLHENYPQVFSEPIHFKNEENSLYSVKSALGISIQEYQHKMKEFKVEDFLKLAIKLCQALHCVHEQNVLHCDIKPQNMLYDKEKDICSIIDFESSFLVSLKNPSIEKNERDSMILQGKFDQFLQSPFSAFIQIIRKYFQILSSESKEKLEIQKQRISRSLDKNGKILTNLVKETYASNLSFNNHTEEALTNFEELMDHGKTNYELLSTALPFLKLLILKFDFKRCKEIIFLILDLYDGSKNISTLDKPMLIKWIQEMFKEVDESLKDVNTAEEFLALIPEKSNDEFTLLCQFLLISNSPFYQNCYFEMMIVVWLLAVKFTIKEGFNEATPAVLCGAAWMYHAVFESAAPRKLGFLGKELMYTVKNPNIQLFYNLHLSLSLIFTGSMEEGIRVGDNGYTYGLSMGEYTFATFCLMVSADAKIMNGTNYNRLHRQLESSKQIIYSTGYYFGGDMLALKTEFTATLVGKSTSFSPQLAIPGFEKYPMVRELYTVAKIECLYLLRDFDSAREEIEKLQSYRFETLGSCPCYDVALFSVLVYFSQSLPKNYLKEIQSNVDYLKKHNEINPLFFAPRYYLALAVQQSLINDDTMKVFASFQKAIKESECSEFLSALSYEYFSEFCKKKSEFEEYSKFLESKAYIKYKRMGAVCKFKHLNPTDFSISEYSSNSDSPSGSTTSTGSNTTMNSGGGGGAIDLQTILKSSSTISEGLDKERLLKKLNEVIVQNAGAERGYIILNENNKYIVKSAFSKDKCHKGKIISENTDIISLKVFNQFLIQKLMGNQDKFRYLFEAAKKIDNNIDE